MLHRYYHVKYLYERVQSIYCSRIPNTNYLINIIAQNYMQHMSRNDLPNSKSC